VNLLLSDTALAVRRAAASGSLAPLARSLAADLEPLLQREIYIPSEKALLSREGGRCPRDGALLEFDPFEPHAHRCPVCGEVCRGELHDRFWIYWYQLWLAERAVHASALCRLGVDARFGDLARQILDGYCERYASYPNVDNVLGPTRLFFSTYLESIWLLQICVAADLLTGAGDLVDRVRDRIVEPSRAIIARFDEDGSNRQVWNDAALLAAAHLVGDKPAAERAVVGSSGIVSQLLTGLLADGTWYEGENYHLFAHRGLWYGVTLAEHAGFEIPQPALDRFERGFSTPFLTALPDLTLPSRRDSQYRISLRQWRIAEHCELGLARRADPALIGALQRLYHDDVPRRETGRRTSSADVERNAPPSSLTRADLSWRALLYARLELPPLVSVAPQSVLLDSQGIAVFRRNDARTYVALDYGHSGGGHGHPDRLNLLLADGDTRWLDDSGTGSYVDPTLHWYRSTLAHNAPLVNGTSQKPVDGRLVAYEETDDSGWIEATVDGIAPQTHATRTLVVMPDYLVDELTVSAESDATVDLPIHADLTLDASHGAFVAGVLDGGGGLEDGFDFLRDAVRQIVEAGTTAHAIARDDQRSLDVWTRGDADTEWWRVRAPGPPGSGDRYFRVLRTRGRLVRHRMVVAWSSNVTGVEIADDVRVTLAGGTTHTHRRAEDGWRVDVSGTVSGALQLRGRIPPPTQPLSSPPSDHATLSLRRNTPRTIELGETHYRRSEATWHEAGAPSATLTLRASDRSLDLAVVVPRSDRTFAPPDAVNRYDNEHPDINGDGVQLHLRFESVVSSWMLIPEPGSEKVRVRAIGAQTDAQTPRARWRSSANGYRMDIELASIPEALDVIVNEMPVGRGRRRGQLVLSGADGEFVYLRGDRHDAGRLLILHIDDA
jgi:Heparinase II/III-like protein